MGADTPKTMMLRSKNNNCAPTNLSRNLELIFQVSTVQNVPITTITEDIRHHYTSTINITTGLLLVFPMMMVLLYRNQDEVFDIAIIIDLLRTNYGISYK
jgi:hypothetical protein